MTDLQRIFNLAEDSATQEEARQKYGELLKNPGDLTYTSLCDLLDKQECPIPIPSLFLAVLAKDRVAEEFPEYLYRILSFGREPLLEEFNLLQTVKALLALFPKKSTILYIRVADLLKTIPVPNLYRLLVDRCSIHPKEIMNTDLFTIESKADLMDDTTNDVICFLWREACWEFMTHNRPQLNDADIGLLLSIFNRSYDIDTVTREDYDILSRVVKNLGRIEAPEYYTFLIGKFIDIRRRMAARLRKP